MTTCSTDPDHLPIVGDELDVLAEMVELSNQSIIELGCGSARLSRGLLQRYPGCSVTGLEVDAIQHAKNLSRPQERLEFVAAGAQSIPFESKSFDLALMLKSLHHVPIDMMDQGLNDVARVLRPRGFLYVSEPIYGGSLNEIVRLYNDEGVVRLAAQAALNRAIEKKTNWEQIDERRFSQAVHFASFDEFVTRMLYPSFTDHEIDEEIIQRVRKAFEPHLRASGATFVRPMHVRLVQRTAYEVAAMDLC